MHTNIRNEYGTISIDNEVIARIAGLTATECYGIVGMAARNVRDGLIHLLKIDSLTKGVRLETKEDGLYVDLHVVVVYGTSIDAIAGALINNVKYKIEESVDIPVREINVYIEGVRVD